jgi:flagellar motor switch protein FliG
MGEMSPEVLKQISGLRKAAIVLVAMGPVASAAILKHIPEEEADRVAKAIAHLEEVTQEEVEACLDEYQQYLTSRRLFVKGGIEYASKILNEAYGIEVAQRLVDRMLKSFNSEGGANFDNFRRADPQQLAKFIQDEHPQTIALILSHLDPSQAATLLSSLPVETRTDVAVRMADLDQISPEIVRNIASVIEQKLRNLGELSREAYGGVRAVANIFNRLDPNTCAQLLDGIERESPSLFENIRRFMFVFRDLEDLDGASISALISRVNRSVLMIALKGSNDSLRQKFLATQSQRGAAMMLDDIGALGPVKLKDVDAAQQEIISVAREMEKEGVISLKSSANEQYVY